MDAQLAKVYESNNILVNVIIMQARLAKKGFSNTTSGNLNAKNNQQSNKVLDLDDFDVQMLSPNFLSSKTLKRPFKQLDIHLAKTNPYGTQIMGPSNDQPRSSSILENSSSKNIQSKPRQNAPLEVDEQKYMLVSGSSLDIRPAYRPVIKQQVTSTPSMQLQFKDKNSIISALMRKGELIQDSAYQIKIVKAQPAAQKAGPAQKKLKSIFNKKDNTLTVETKRRTKQVIQSEIQIGQEINEAIEEDYGNQQFDKISGAYQSQIKQSIRESIGHSSGVIKQSIRESIRQSVRQSIRDEIPQSFRSAKSKEEVKEEIMDSKNKESVEEEVYEQIFEEASLSDELSKSKSKFKKQKQDDKFQLSASASKKFRTKTNTLTKSIKFAQQLTIQNQLKNTDNKMQQKFEKGDQLASQIIKERSNFQKLQQKISNILDSHTFKVKKQVDNKNLELYYKFKIEINRLITSENFMSKLRKLTAFLGTSSGSNGKAEDVTTLQDKLLANLMERIHDLRVSGVTQAQLAGMKKDYDQKVAYLLKQQEMALRIEMDKKLHQKDLQLKKMIAELQQKLRKAGPISYYDQKPMSYGDRVEVDSDYSIESDDISWKMDLWEVLPDYEKKKLYEKQGSEIAKFLTDALLNEIKNENLDRSADISFEFPEQFNTSRTYSDKSTPQPSKTASKVYQEQMRPTIDREQLRKQVQKGPEKVQIFPPLPGVKKSNTRQQHFENNIHFLQMPLGKIAENEIRDTTSVSDVIKILAKYKGMFMKKKNDLIRKLVKTLQLKPKQSEPMSSLINQIRILNSKEITPEDQPFVKAYEEDIIMELVSIYNKNTNRKNTSIEQEMKKMYDRLVVTSQVKTAECSVRSPNEIIPNQNYIHLRMGQEDRRVKDGIVNQIVSVLMAQFAKQMPKGRR